jgi:hypothetical protein
LLVLAGVLCSGVLGCSEGWIGALINYPPPQDGLIARWGFDADAGSKVVDLSGHHQDGDVEGEALWHPVDGKVLGALELGEESYVLFRGFGGPGEDAKMSVAAWLRSVSGSGATLPLLSTGDSGWGVYYDPTAKRVFFTKADSGSVQAQADLSTDTWRHIAAVDNGELLLLYIDGHLAASAAIDTRGGSQPQDLHLAANPDDPGVASTGLVDDVLVYNRALSCAEVASISGTRAAPAPDSDPPDLALETFTLRGQILDPQSVASLTINGTAVVVQADGAWELTLQVPDGLDEIVFAVTSPAGDHAEKRLQVEQSTLAAAGGARSVSDGQHNGP